MKIAAEAIDGTFVPRARDSVTSLELDRELVLLDRSTWMLHRLNPVATRAWTCFDGVATIDDLVANLSDAFGQDPAVVRPAILDLVRELGRQQLLDGVLGEVEPENGFQGGYIEPH